MNVREMQNGSYVCDDDPGEPETGKPRISITPDEGRFLGFLVAMKRVLEIGTGLGVSTDYLAVHARRVVTVDNDPWVWANVWPGLHNKVTTLTEREHVEGMFDVVFIDGNHTTEATEEDVKFARRHMTRGLIVVHDANIEEVYDGLLDDDLNWMVVPTAHGMALAFVGFA